MNQEQDLLKRARRLDENALAEIYDRYSDELYRYAMRFLNDVQMAEDCVMDTFSRFLKALHRGGGPDNYVRAYLYRIAHNWITDHYRRRTPHEESLILATQQASEHDPSKVVQDRQERELVRRTLMVLTPDQRLVITLKFLEGWENDEIAQSLGKRVGAVKALQHRGLAAIQRQLSKQEYPE
jgi:RNA polymerase sigma-70 factor, ECF subfamily